MTVEPLACAASLDSGSNKLEMVISQRLAGHTVYLKPGPAQQPRCPSDLTHSARKLLQMTHSHVGRRGEHLYTGGLANGSLRGQAGSKDRD